MTGFNVSFPGLGIHDLPIKRELITVFGFPIYWYGFLIAVAVLLTLFLARRASKSFGIKEDDVIDTYLIILPTIIVFARLYYVIFSWSEYKDNLWLILDTRRGGLAFYGGVIGGILAFACICAFKKKRLVNWLDFFVVYLPLGQAIGRWGNFFNQEAFGSNTELPWGMISEGTRAYLQTLHDSNLNPAAPVHPTFLYEFIGNMLIFAILLYVRKHATFYLETVAWYIMTYGCLRFFVEAVRTDALFIGNTGIRVSMLLSFLMFVAGIVYLAYGYWQISRQKLPAKLRLSWGAALEIATASDATATAATDTSAEDVPLENPSSEEENPADENQSPEHENQATGATASDATATVTTDTSATAEQKAADQPATTTKKDN